MPSKELIITVGLPKSGKTTWARQQNHPIVCPDAIRLALHGQRFIDLAEPHVWAISLTMVRALFLAGHQTVIVDATHTTKKRRDFWKSSDWRVSYQKFSTTKEECIRRAVVENDNQIIPVIERMASQWEEIDAE